MNVIPMATTEFVSSKFCYSLASHVPTLDIQPGETLRITCPDCDNFMADGSVLSESQRQVAAHDTVQGNPLAGPIFVQGAEPGDTMVVRIEAVEPDSGTGRTLLAPDHGLLSDEQLSPKDMEGNRRNPKHMYLWDIDVAAGVATMRNPIGGHPMSLPLEPFVGCIGVCPSGTQVVGSLYCGASGGNLDLPMFGVGSTVLLPVEHPGGLFMIGDLHAAQGHGEVIGGGIETSGRVTCTISLIKGRSAGALCVLGRDKVWAVGVEGDLRLAVQASYLNLLNWLTHENSADRYDLYNLLSQCATVTLGNLNEKPYPVATGVAINRLPETIRRGVDSWRA